MKHAITISAALLFAAAGLASAAPSFSGTGTLGLNAAGDFSFSRISGLSDDGSIAVGISTSPLGQRAVQWTSGGGLVALPTLSGGPVMDSANSVSGDGSMIVGTSPSAASNGFTIGEATVWSGGVASPMGFIAPADTMQSNIVSVTSDGSVMVGLSSSPGVLQFEATRWVGGVAQGLGAGDGSSATAVSQDGTFIAGSRAGTNGAFLGAFLWSELGGLTELQDIATGGFFDSGATALDITADGSLIVGWATDTFSQRPVAWDQAGTPTDIGTPFGYDAGLANAISDDGTVIVGSASSFLGETAFIWTQATGSIEMLGFLQPFVGSALDGWTLTSADAISADGLTFAGVGINPQGEFGGWVAQIPTPGAAVVLSAGLLLGARRRRSR